MKLLKMLVLVGVSSFLVAGDSIVINNTPTNNTIIVKDSGLWGDDVIVINNVIPALAPMLAPVAPVIAVKRPAPVVAPRPVAVASMTQKSPQTNSTIVTDNKIVLNNTN